MDTSTRSPGGDGDGAPDGGPQDEVHGVATDGANAVYVAGRTDGALDGQTSAGDMDAFVTKYDASGNKLWTRQLGTPSTDEAYGVTTDGAGGIYVAGSTRGALDGQTSSGDYDIFVTKFDASGTRQWTCQLGTPSSEVANAVAVLDPTRVYLAGSTYGDLEGLGNAGDTDIVTLGLTPP